MQQQPIFCNDGSHRSAAEKKELLRRLKIVSGQINTIMKLVRENEPCDKVLLNCMSTSSALKSTGNLIIKGHIENLFSKKLENNNEEVEYLNSLFHRLNK